MPIHPEFDDIYKFGIKGAAGDAGAYAERLDDQIFQEGMLERIFNQISKADVIVADMTGRNPNVFYEVGYAHALDKIVILLTQKSDDIPFDLQHRQHIVYKGKIDLLRSKLVTRLQWAIEENSRKTILRDSDRFSIRMDGLDIPRLGMSKKIPEIKGYVTAKDFTLRLHLRNDSQEKSVGITHVYLFTEEDGPLIPCEYNPVSIMDNLSTFSYTSPVGETQQRFTATPLESFTAVPVDAPDSLTKQFRLRTTFPQVPPGAVEVAQINLMFREGESKVSGKYRLRLHSAYQYHDYPFTVSIELKTQEEVEAFKKSSSGKHTKDTKKGNRSSHQKKKSLLK
jgi:hypothetical protein